MAVDVAAADELEVVGAALGTGEITRLRSMLAVDVGAGGGAEEAGSF